MARFVVLDTGALLAGLGPALGTPGTRFLTPPGARAEIRPGGATGRALERALAAGLEVRAPSPEALAAVGRTLEKTGETTRASSADREVLALAVDLAAGGPVEIWSDDYSVQNNARALGLKAVPIVTRGIRQVIHWHIRCTGCARYFDAETRDGTCPVCGSPLKRTRRPPS